MAAFVAFDYTNLTAEVKGGIGPREFGEFRPRLRRAVDDFLEDPRGFMRLPHTTEFSDPSEALAGEVHASGATDFVHVGIGGSALGHRPPPRPQPSLPQLPTEPF